MKILLSKKCKRILVYLATLLLSLLFIVIGNRYVSRNAVYFENEASTPQRGKVMEILERRVSDSSVGTEGSVTEDVTLIFSVRLESGPDKGITVRAAQYTDPYYAVKIKEVEVGDRILIYPMENESLNLYWSFSEYVRTDALLVLGVVFCLFLFLFGRSKGIHTLISLVFTCLAVFMVFLPSVLNGLNIYFWSILVCIFIIVMTLLIINGADSKSLVAGIGCISGVLTAGLLTLIMDHFLKLTGLLDDESMYLYFLNTEYPINLKAIIFAAIIIGAVGAIMDVAISLASSLLEIREHAKHPSLRLLIHSGFTIGRDMMGTMANTLILAYIGSSLSVVLLLTAYNNSLLALLNKEMIVVEILQALVGSFGILLTIPLTTIVGAIIYTRRPHEACPPPALKPAEIPTENAAGFAQGASQKNSSCAD